LDTRVFDACRAASSSSSAVDNKKISWQRLTTSTKSFLQL
jgi:hypothetical protein